MTKWARIRGGNRSGKLPQSQNRENMNAESDKLDTENRYAEQQTLSNDKIGSDTWRESIRETAAISRQRKLERRIR